MANQTLTPSTVVNLANGVTGAKDWQSESDATSDDALYAFSTFDATSAITKYLYSSEYGFAIPSDAVITGFTATVQKRASGTAQDHFVGLTYPDGTNVSITFPGKQDGTNWTSGESTSNYGNSNDPWNRGWTPAEVNDQNFGIVISAQGNVGDSPLVDVCKITVNYNRVYDEIPSGGVSSGGDSETALTMNVVATGGGVVSRVDTHDVDGTGGAEFGGLASVFTINNVTRTNNIITFVCTGDQVVPENAATEVVHASIAYDPTTNVIRWYINNTISGVDAVRLRGPASEGATGGTRVNIDGLQSVSANPIIGQATITGTQMTELVNGLWYLYMRDDQTGKIVRGQIVQRANLGAAGKTNFIYDEEATAEGVTLGGRAYFIWSDDATGGAEAGGENTAHKVRDEIASGGIEVSGLNTNQKSTVLDGLGGLEVGGSSTIQTSYSAVGIDGALAGGKIIQGIHPYIAPAGVEGGAEANPFNINNPVTSGGVDVEGSIKINMYWLHNPVEDGGVVCLGSARKERVRQLQKAIISGIGNSLFSDNILKVVPEKETLFPPATLEDQPELPEQVYFETPPGWCFTTPNHKEECCALVAEDDTVTCDASIPKVLEKRQKHYLPPQKRTNKVRDRRIATAQVD